MLRFAPSPTGDMHIGNLRVAIFNYIVARQKGEKFLLRIEDTDQERNVEGKDVEILNILDKFGLKYDKLIYQSHQKKFHHQFIHQLLVQKKVFNCFCTNKVLEAKRKTAIAVRRPYRYDDTCLKLSDNEVLNSQKLSAIRLKRPAQNIAFKDAIKGLQNFDPIDIDSFIILRKDKSPTYNFACAIDDMLFNTNMVIRGEDHLSNTSKQLAIFEALGYDEPPVYAHLPIILNQKGKKMSKRDDSSSVQWLLNEGFLPSAITNYLILLGNKTPCEIFTLKEAIQFFNLSNISKSAARFDIDKLRFINREHIKKIPAKTLGEIVGYFDENIGEIVKIYTEEDSTIKEIKSKIERFFAKKEFGQWKKNAKKIIEVLKDIPFNDDYKAFSQMAMKRTNLKGKDFFKPFRLVITGAENGPDLSKIVPFLKTYWQELF